MRTIYTIFIFSLVLFCLVLSCKKEADQPTPSTPTTPTSVTPTITSISPMSGTVGTKVVITGTGFSTTLANNTVKFGSTAATLDSASTTRLVTKVPQGAQTGKVSVTVSGTTVSSNADFTVTVAPVATAPVFNTAIAAQSFITIGITTAQVVSALGQTGNQPISQHGHVWSKTSQIPTLTSNNGKTELGPITTVSAPYNFTSNLTGLEAATSYTVRAYVSTQAATTYGSSFTITTLPSTIPTGTNCKLSKFTELSSSGSLDEATLEYDTQGRIAKIKINKGGEATYTYGSNGELLTYFSLGSPSQGGENSLTQSFTYTSGKLTQYSEKSIFQGKVEYDIRYETALNIAGQISRIQQVNSGAGAVAGDYITLNYTGSNLTSIIKSVGGTWLFTYDNQQNAFSSVLPSEAHKIAVGTLNGFSKNGLLTAKYFDKQGLLDDSEIYNYTYNHDGYPSKGSKVRLYGIIFSPNTTPSTSTITYTYSNCQ